MINPGPTNKIAWHTFLTLPIMHDCTTKICWQADLLVNAFETLEPGQTVHDKHFEPCWSCCFYIWPLKTSICDKHSFSSFSYVHVNSYFQGILKHGQRILIRFPYIPAVRRVIWEPGPKIGRKMEACAVKRGQRTFSVRRFEGNFETNFLLSGVVVWETCLGF